MTSEFQQVINRDLHLIVEAHEREELLAELQRHRDHLREMVAEKSAELVENNEELKKALDEIKTLKEKLEAENIYLREEMELSEGFKEIVGARHQIQARHREKQ